MQFRAHRGYAGYPENTIPAFKKAIEEGFEQLETDPNYTKDGVIVLLHDNSINRTLRNKNGSPIGREIRLSEITYEELLQYDAGIAYGEEFRSTMIPRLEELLELLDGTEVVLDLDKKIATDKLDEML